MNNDEKWMREAICQAKLASKAGEVPVGAVIVRNGKLIAADFNHREQQKNALCHAELSVIEKACQQCGGWRLEDCELFVTLEPCPMCAGAAINARLKRVVFGAYDPKNGACGSVANLMTLPFTHQPALTCGVSEQECAALLTDFFAGRRQTKTSGKKGIIFELNGTLWDSSLSLTKAWNKILSEYGSSVSLQKAVKLTEQSPSVIAQQLLPALSARESLPVIERCFEAEGVFLQKDGAALYPDTEEILRTLSEEYKLFIVSNCSEACLTAFLDRCQDLRSCFTDIERQMKNGRSKAENIRLIMKRNHLSKAIFVGSTESARIAADTAGIPFVFAAYGCGTPRNSSTVIHSPSELPAAANSLMAEKTQPVSE